MKAKSFFITILLSLFVASGLWAQDKYEYATVAKLGATITFITSDNEEIIQTTLKESMKHVLKKVNELSDKGWEVYNTTSSEANSVVTYYLRKKKQ